MRSRGSLSAEMLLLQVSVLLLFAVSDSEDVAEDARPCPPEFAEEIRDAVYLADGDVRSGVTGVVYGPDDVFTVNSTLFGCVCRAMSCLRKCCPLGEHVFNKTCQKSDLNFFDNAYVRVNESERVVEGFLHCAPGKDRYLLQPFYDESEEFRVQDGVLIWENLSLSFGYEDFCVDVFDDGDFNDTRALVCSESYKELIDYYLGMIISMPFLLITFLVYATLPDRNIHGKSLMCYVLSLLLAYVFLVAILMKSDYQPVPCQILAYVCYFFFLASFFWMNVMCIDIWWTFSGKRGIVGSKRKSQKRFILFSCYAWGVPIFFLALLAVLNHTLPENSDFHPKVGYMKCWISDGVPLLLYFYGTMALLIVFNVILFILTALKIRQAKKETAMLKKGDSKRHSYENEKQRFNLYLKLLLAMGLNWAMEVISWIFEWQVKDLPKTVWILTDTCNALYGVFIFFIFVFKRNIWNHLQRRYYVFTGRSVKANNLANSISNPTRTTSQSFQDKIPMGEVASSVGP